MISSVFYLFGQLKIAHKPQASSEKWVVGRLEPKIFRPKVVFVVKRCCVVYENEMSLSLKPIYKTDQTKCWGFCQADGTLTSG